LSSSARRGLVSSRAARPRRSAFWYLRKSTPRRASEILDVFEMSPAEAPFKNFASKSVDSSTSFKNALTLPSSCDREKRISDRTKSTEALRSTVAFEFLRICLQASSAFSACPWRASLRASSISSAPDGSEKRVKRRSAGRQERPSRIRELKSVFTEVEHPLL